MSRKSNNMQKGGNHSNAAAYQAYQQLSQNQNSGHNNGVPLNRSYEGSSI
jgi:hypothetical protein